MNNSVTVPRAYFLKTALRDYTYPLGALVREFLQNSRDAGATEIRIDVTEQDGNVVMTCDDNGRGMDRDTIVTKLMALGETDKGAGQTGGFGVAKILLFFAHQSYRIETRDLLVEGEGGQYRVTEGQPYRKGVRASVVLGREFEARVEGLLRTARCHVRACWLPGTKIWVGEKEIAAELKRGRQVEEIAPGVTLHRAKAACEECYAAVRVRGLHMFNIYIAPTKSRLIVEMDGYSTEYLTTNRDGLRGELREKIEALCQAYALDSTRGSKSTITLWKGKSSRLSESVAVPLVQDLNRRIGALVQAGKHEEVEQVLVDVEQSAPPEAAVVLTAMRRDIVRRAQQQTWVPLQVEDFTTLPHHYFAETRGKFRKLPDKWKPENFTSNQKFMLDLWARLISMVMADAGFTRTEFDVGFLLDNTSEPVLANFRARTEPGTKNLFLINPYGYNSKALPLKRERRTELVMWLLSVAVHEVTHAEGRTLHDENFTSAYAELYRKCCLRIKKYLALAGR